MSKWRFWLGLAFVFISSLHSFAQGTVRGKVTDENGEAMIGVTIFLKENSSIGVSTDLDGLYSLSLPETATHTLVVSYISYETIEMSVTAEAGGVVIHDFVLVPSSVALNEV